MENTLSISFECPVPLFTRVKQSIPQASESVGLFVLFFLLNEAYLKIFPLVF